MLKLLLGFFLKGPFQDLTEKVQEAYVERLKAETSEKKLEMDGYIAHLQAQQEVLLAEQRRLLTAWIRPALALPVVAYVWKLIIWDTMLGWGMTPDPGSFVNWLVVTIVGAYMLTRPFETKGR